MESAFERIMAGQKKRAAAARDNIDFAIENLTEIRDSITEFNVDKFDIQMGMNRDLDSLYMHGQLIGFKQASGWITSIRIEDKTNKGKPLI